MEYQEQENERSNPTLLNQKIPIKCMSKGASELQNNIKINVTQEDCTNFGFLEFLEDTAL